MAAKFPLTISVSFKYLAAVRTGKGIDCLSLHQVKMPVPPLVSATIRAKAFLLSSRGLFYLLAAAFTHRFSTNRNYQVAPSAE
jgi:hypothetical protein